MLRPLNLCLHGALCVCVNMRELVYIYMFVCVCVCVFTIRMCVNVLIVYMRISSLYGVSVCVFV